MNKWMNTNRSNDDVTLIIAKAHIFFHDSLILILWKHFGNVWVSEISEGGVGQINWQNKDDREDEMYQTRENHF